MKTPDHSPAGLNSTRAYRAYVLALLLAAYSMSYIDRVLVGTLAPLIQSDLHVSDSVLGLLNGTAYAVLYVVFCLPFGWLADRQSRQRIISTCLAVWSTATIVFGLGHSVSVMLLSRATIGATESGCVAPSHSMLMDYFDRTRRARVLAIWGLGVPLGVALGTAAGAWLGALLGWRKTFICAGIAGLLLALLMKLTLREPARVAASETERPLPLVQSVKAISSEPAYWLVVAGISCGAMSGIPQFFWLPTFFVRTYGLQLVKVGTLMGGVNFVCGICGALIGAWIADHYARKWQAAYPTLLSLCYAISAPLLLAAFFAKTYVLSFVLYGMATLIISFGHGPTIAAIQQLATSRLRGTASAIMNVVLITLGMGLTVPVVGVISDALASRLGKDSLQYALIILPVTQAVGAVFFLFAARRFARGAALAAIARVGGLDGVRALSQNDNALTASQC